MTLPYSSLHLPPSASVRRQGFSPSRHSQHHHHNNMTESQRKQEPCVNASTTSIQNHSVSQFANSAQFSHEISPANNDLLSVGGKSTTCEESTLSNPNSNSSSTLKREIKRRGITSRWPSSTPSKNNTGLQKNSSKMICRPSEAHKLSIPFLLNYRTNSSNHENSPENSLVEYANPKALDWNFLVTTLFRSHVLNLKSGRASPPNMHSSHSYCHSTHEHTTTSCRPALTQTTTKGFRGGYSNPSASARWPHSSRDVSPGQSTHQVPLSSSYTRRRTLASSSPVDNNSREPKSLPSSQQHQNTPATMGLSQKRRNSIPPPASTAALPPLPTRLAFSSSAASKRRGSVVMHNPSALTAGGSAQQQHAMDNVRQQRRGSIIVMHENQPRRVLLLPQNAPRIPGMVGAAAGPHHHGQKIVGSRRNSA